MFKKRAVLILILLGGSVAVICGYIAFKMIDPPSFLPVFSQNRVEQKKPVLFVTTLDQLFSALENSLVPQAYASIPEENRVVSLYYEKAGIPYLLEIIVSTQDSANEFFVLHQPVVEAAVKIYGPIRGNRAKVIEEIRSFQPGQEIFSSFKVKAVDFH